MALGHDPPADDCRRGLCCDPAQLVNVSVNTAVWALSLIGVGVVLLVVKANQREPEIKHPYREDIPPWWDAK